MPEDVVSQGDAHRIAVLTTDERLEPAMQEFLASSFHTTMLNSAEQITALRHETQLKALIVDLDDQDESGQLRLEFVEELKQADPDLVLIGLARSRSTTLRNKAKKAGIGQLFVAPVDFQKVQIALSQALEKRRMKAEALRLHEEAARGYVFCELIGGSEAMRLVYEAISRVANGNTTVMIRG